jgi:hypothetical protein
MKFYMFRTVLLSIIRSFSLYTQQWYMSYSFADSSRAGSGWKSGPSWSCSQAVYKHVWRIPFLCVQWKTPDDGQRNCPKHVEFHSKEKVWEISASSWLYYTKLSFPFWILKFSTESQIMLAVTVNGLSVTFSYFIIYFYFTSPIIQFLKALQPFMTVAFSKELNFKTFRTALKFILFCSPFSR